MSSRWKERMQRLGKIESMKKIRVRAKEVLYHVMDDCVWASSSVLWQRREIQWRRMESRKTNGTFQGMWPVEAYN